tara:strand:+ start:1292 stop:1438 length:147 start_codon:yes stop_codon:yes gene_type:complete
MKTKDRTTEIKNEAEIDESADMWTEEELTEIRNRADLEYYINQTLIEE